MNRRFFISVVASGIASLPISALAQGTAYPSRPVRIIVPFTAGGSCDALARVVGQGLTQRWKQNVVVENIPGASAIVGTDRAAKSDPDGYTILFGTISNLAVNPSLYEGRLPYDPLRSFAAVTLAASVPLLLVVNERVPATSVGELIALTKTRQDLNYGSGGNGTSQHLAMELLKQSAGAALTHVPYRSSAPALTDLVSGQIQVMFDNLNTALPHVQSGKLRALAITSRTRARQAPDVPTITEQGFPAVEMGTWFAFLVPAGTPPEIIQKLNTDIVGVLTDPGVKAQLGDQGMEVIASVPDRLTAHIRDEIGRWDRVEDRRNSHRLTRCGASPSARFTGFRHAWVQRPISRSVL